MALYKFLDFNDHTCHRLNVNILEQNDVKKNYFFGGGGIMKFCRCILLSCRRMVFKLKLAKMFMFPRDLQTEVNELKEYT